MDSQEKFSAWVLRHQARLEAVANKELPSENNLPQTLHKAMRYAVMGGGKRVRPLLVYAAGALTEADISTLDLSALAVECVHSYSLVHDDLPCMDNDTLRHGKPTVHIQFGEATAMLAGDALQPEAFCLLAKAPLEASQQMELVKLLAQASSTKGMCGGQAIDLSVVGEQVDLPLLRRMHAMKTGALLTCAVLMGAWSGKKELINNALITYLTEYGSAIGLAFQIVDDILDVLADEKTLGKTAGKDAASDKPTYVSLMGLEQARVLAQEQHERACAALESIEKERLCVQPANRLREIADFVVQRSY